MPVTVSSGQLSPWPLSSVLDPGDPWTQQGPHQTHKFPNNATPARFIKFPSNLGFKPEHHMGLYLLTHPHMKTTTISTLLWFWKVSQILQPTTTTSHLHAVEVYLLSPWVSSPMVHIHVHQQSEFLSILLLISLSWSKILITPQCLLN